MHVEVRLSVDGLEAKGSDEFGGTGLCAAVHRTRHAQPLLQPLAPFASFTPERRREHAWKETTAAVIFRM